MDLEVENRETLYLGISCGVNALHRGFIRARPKASSARSCSLVVSVLTVFHPMINVTLFSSRKKFA
jgi:hypothetical protein